MSNQMIGFVALMGIVTFGALLGAAFLKLKEWLGSLNQNKDVLVSVNAEAKPSLETVKPEAPAPVFAMEADEAADPVVHNEVAHEYAASSEDDWEQYDVPSFVRRGMAKAPARPSPSKAAQESVCEAIIISHDDLVHDPLLTALG